MTNEQLLTKAKSKLTISHPYFGMLASKLRHEASDKVTAYASNGKRFLYNEEFMSRRSLEDVQFILTNCVMHHVLAHQQRKLKRRGPLWQIATDYAINNILKQNGLHIPPGANYNEEFEKMYAEEIYEQLKDDFFDGTDTFDDTENWMNDLPNENLVPGSSPEEQADAQAFGDTSSVDDEEMSAEDESNWQYSASVAKEVATRKSSMPAGLERLAKKMKSSGVDWRFELYNAINKHMRNNYAFMPPNKKHLYRGVALPSLASDTLSLCVCVDSSGSINDELLGAFMEEFKVIMTNFPSIRIELIIADAKVHAHHTFYGGEKLDFPIKGGGGTDYRPVFDYVDANLPNTTMMLYFTDGDGWFPRIPPGYEVLWALSRQAKVPFGRGLLLFG